MLPRPSRLAIGQVVKHRLVLRDRSPILVQIRDYRLNSLYKLVESDFLVPIEVHSSQDADDLLLDYMVAYFPQKDLQIRLIDVVIVAHIELLEGFLERELGALLNVAFKSLHNALKLNLLLKELS